MSIPSLTLQNFFTEPYMLRPNALRDPTDRTICWLATIILGVFTLGLVHATTALVQWIFRALTSSETDEVRKTNELYKKVLENNITTTLDAKQIFDDLEENTEAPEYLGTFEASHNFNDILCPKDTAVKVGDRYLHGNFVEFIKNKYISTQAPNYHAFYNPNLFWEVCFKYSEVIVDLTKQGETPAYYPQKEQEKITYGDLEVTCNGIKEKEKEKEEENIKTCTYIINNTTTGETKKVTRVHYLVWVDHDGTAAFELKMLIDHVERCVQKGKNPNAHVIVHCKAGIGRTGTFITATELKYVHDQHKEKIDETNYSGWMKTIILSGRKQRGEHFVQRHSQVQTILDFEKELGNNTR